MACVMRVCTHYIMHNAYTQARRMCPRLVRTRRLDVYMRTCHLDVRVYMCAQSRRDSCTYVRVRSRLDHMCNHMCVYSRDRNRRRTWLVEIVCLVYYSTARLDKRYI